MRLFIKTGAAWIFQTGNMIPQCHPTQRKRSLGELELEQAEVKSQIGTQLPGTTCSKWKDTEMRPRGWGCDRGSVKPYLTTSACTGARSATENSLCCGKPLGQAQACACIVYCVCVDGEDGCACGHTRNSSTAIKPNWRWGIKPGCVEWYLGCLEWEGWDRKV